MPSAIPKKGPPGRPRPRPAVVAADHHQLDLPLFDVEALAPLATSEPVTGETPAGRAAPGARIRVLPLDGRVLEYRLKRSSRRSIGFSIDASGLTVTAPRWVTLADIETAIADKRRWIFNKLTEWRTRAETRALPRIDWQDGAQLPYLGRQIRLKLASVDGALHYDAERAELSLALPAQASEQQIKDRVQGWLQGEARRLFGERLAFYAERLGVRYTAYALSSATTRWGSCSSDGKIRLNWRLIHFPPAIVDYVVAHELAHLREMNHSPAFWRTVESIFPEFREARNTLRHHAPELLPAF